MFEKVEKAPTSRTLTQFILPLVSQFLCTEKHLGKNTLIDAGIQVCPLLIISILFCSLISHTY